MKTIIIHVAHDATPNGWDEEYEINDDEDPRNYAELLIAQYNVTITNPFDHRRRVESVYVAEEDVNATKHDWRKTNLTSIARGNRIYDTYKCSRCGVPGKRYGLTNNVVINSDYSGKVWQRCDTALAHIAKRKAKNR